jgi:5'-nucleotidase / UDP-sugar diphosphatase
MFELKGKDIREALEHSAIFDEDEKKYNFLQPSGLRYAVGLEKPKGYRISNVNTKNGKKLVPLKDEKMYKVVTISYLTAGKDGFTMLKNNKTNLQ